MDEVHHDNGTASMVTRSAMAFAHDVADDTASHEVAYARAGPTRYSWMIRYARLLEGDAVNDHTHPPTRWRKARDGSMAKSHRRRMHPRRLKSAKPKRRKRGHEGLKA